MTVQVNSRQNLGKFVAKECPKVLALMAPLLGRGIGQYSVNLIGIHYIATTAPEHLPGTTLGMSFTTMLGWAAIGGQSTALCTLTAHAVGASTFRSDIAPDMYVNTAVFVHAAWTVVPLLTMPLLYMILFSMGQEPAVIYDAMRYLFLSLASLPFFAVLTSYRRYLEAMMRPYPPSVICVCGVLILQPLLLVVGDALRPEVAPPIAMTAMFCCTAAGIVRYVGPVRGFPSVPAKAQVVEYLELAVPAMLSMMAEWWSSEVLVVASGMLGRAPLTANASCSTLLTFLYQICYAFGTSCSVRVGYWLAAGYPKRAQQTLLLHSLLGLLSSAAVVAALLTWRYDIARVLVGDGDPATLELAASLLPPIARFYFLVTLQSMLYGALCGAGKQRVSFYNTLVSYWPLGIPVGLYLGFSAGRGVHGFWDGLFLGVSVNLVLNVVYLFGIMDWATVVDPAKVAVAACGAEPVPSHGCSVESTGMDPQVPLADTEDAALNVRTPGYGTLSDNAPVPR
eukprot:TRINITY_DN448_c0_g3_i1.p1 TRINITY_DN448_c0_g3~~TRINITY_DN448_c0_g3_i1.p1  ORF type:complete len:509 (+),score=139.95 TRINITY_DN448_c0_g3_i1:84-1610(+)